MRNNLNTVLLLVAILLLGYIAFLKPQPQRFVNARGYRHLLLDTATGRLCDARTPSKEALEQAQFVVEFAESIATEKEPAPPEGFVLEEARGEQKTALEHSKDALYNLLHPSKQYPLCSEF